LRPALYVPAPGPHNEAKRGRTIREDVVYWARELERRGLVVGTAGNISVRDADRGVLWVTPSGLPYASMEPDDIVAVDPGTGDIVEGRRRPTSELWLHIMVYRARSGVGAVVHTHSLYATMFAVAGRPIPPVHYLMGDLGPMVPVVPYARFGTRELAAATATALADAHAALLAHHGAVAVGATLAEAFRRAELVEWLAHVAWGAAALGGARVLPREALAEAAGALAAYYGREDVPAPPDVDSRPRLG
jgi:L-fuculose-phosphate aldolase